MYDKHQLAHSDAHAAPKWRQLGELAMSRGQLAAAATCLARAADLSGLLLLHAAQVHAWAVF
jgi:coatomer subunit beta'